MLKDDKKNTLEGLIDETLSQAPELSLSGNFADNIAEKVARRFAWEQYFREFLIYLSVIVGILTFTGGVAFIWLKASWEAWFNLITSNSVYVIGVVFMLLFVLFADKVLLRYFFYRYSINQSLRP